MFPGFCFTDVDWEGLRNAIGDVSTLCCPDSNLRSQRIILIVTHAYAFTRWLGGDESHNDCNRADGVTLPTHIAVGDWPSG